MRILYIDRTRPPVKLKWWVQRNLKGLTDGQEGFFEASLFMAGKVTKTTLDGFLARQNDFSGFDALVVNLRCGLDWDLDNPEFWSVFERFPAARRFFSTTLIQATCPRTRWSAGSTWFSSANPMPISSATI